VNNILKNDYSIVASIPINNQPNSMLLYQNPNDYRINLLKETLNHIHIRLTDQLGNALNLNGQYFTMTIQLDCVNFGE
jgi:hypothetical protein